jgi:pseudaminic acid synthase
MKIKLNNKYVSRSSKPYFIAEISANHNGSLVNAKKLILTAKLNGADAVKLQTYEEDAMTIKSKSKKFLIKDGIWKGYYLWDLFKKAKTPYKWHKSIFDYAKKIKITCFSSPFDEKAVDVLEDVNCPFYKIASYEMDCFPLLKKIAATKKPIIISTGMAQLSEIKKSIKFLEKNGARKIIILYCVTAYPAKSTDFNLRNIQILRNHFKYPIGFSDHSNDTHIATSAVCMGANIFEKHIGYNDQKKGFDINFSTTGKDITSYKENLINAWTMTNRRNFFRSTNELKSIKDKRSIFCIKTIEKNERFSEKNIKSLRPNIGLENKYYFKLLNKKSKKKINLGPLNKNFKLYL